MQENRTVKTQQTEQAAEIAQVQVLQPEQSPVTAAELTGLEQRLNYRIEKASGGKTGLLWTVTIIALAAAAYNGFTVFTQQQRLSAMESSYNVAMADFKSSESRYQSGLDKVDGTFKMIEQRSADLGRAYDNVNRLQLDHGKLAENDQKLAEKVTALEQQWQAEKSSLQDVVNKVQRFEERNPHDWMLAESFFLVNNAAQKAVFEQDVTAAAWMLTKADELLVGIEDEKIIALREAIAKDLALLKGISAPDLRGMGITLDTAYDSVDRLVFNEFISPDKAFVKDNAPSANLSDWKQNLISSADAFSKRFIEVRRRDSATVTEFLSPEQSHYVRENIKTFILLAKANLSHGDKELMQNNLKHATSLINAYFDKKDATTKSVLELIGKVAGSDISMQTPKVLESANAFSAYAQENLLGRGK